MLPCSVLCYERRLCRMRSSLAGPTNSQGEHSFVSNYTLQRIGLRLILRVYKDKSFANFYSIWPETLAGINS